MNLFIENYAQLIAIAAPVLTLVAMNLLLAIGGERGTLLLPSAGPFRTAMLAANTMPAHAASQAPGMAANDPAYHRAA
jgi:hypothetical protein